MSIVGNMAGCYSPMGKTFIIEDEHGNQLTGVVTEQKQIFTATDNDVREGMVYAGDSGVSTGTKDIPAYYTTEGTKLVANGEFLKIPLLHYEYTALQCIICEYNTNLQNSVSAKQVVINGFIYNANSTDVISEVTTELTSSGGVINLGITNTSGIPVLIRYFTFKEMY